MPPTVVQIWWELTDTTDLLHPETAEVVTFLIQQHDSSHSHTTSGQPSLPSLQQVCPPQLPFRNSWSISEANSFLSVLSCSLPIIEAAHF